MVNGMVVVDMKLTIVPPSYGQNGAPLKATTFEDPYWD